MVKVIIEALMPVFWFYFTFSSQHIWHALKASEYLRFFLKHLNFVSLNTSISFLSLTFPILNDKQGYTSPCGFIIMLENGYLQG